MAKLDARDGYAEFTECGDKVSQLKALEELLYKNGQPMAAAECKSATLQASHALSEAASRKEYSPFLSCGWRDSVSEIKRQTEVTRPTDALPRIFIERHNPIPVAAHRFIVGRILNRIDNGFAVGIGGLVAFLPLSELPAGVRFTQRDFLIKKSYEFRLLGVRFNDGEDFFVQVSLRS